MKATIEKSGRQYRICISESPQYFYLYTTGTKQHAAFMAKMFGVALKKHNKEVIKKHERTKQKTIKK